MLDFGVRIADPDFCEPLLTLKTQKQKPWFLSAGLPVRTPEWRPENHSGSSAALVLQKEGNDPGITSSISARWLVYPEAPVLGVLVAEPHSSLEREGCPWVGSDEGVVHRVES